MVDDLPYALVIVLNAGHGDDCRLAVGDKVPIGDDAIDGVLVVVNDEAFQVLMPVCVEAPEKLCEFVRGWVREPSEVPFYVSVDRGMGAFPRVFKEYLDNCLFEET